MSSSKLTLFFLLILTPYLDVCAFSDSKKDAQLERKMKKIVNFHLWRGKCIDIKDFKEQKKAGLYEVTAIVKVGDTFLLNRYVVSKSLKTIDDRFELLEAIDLDSATRT